MKLYYKIFERPRHYIQIMRMTTSFIIKQGKDHSSLPIQGYKVKPESNPILFYEQLIWALFIDLWNSSPKLKSSDGNGSHHESAVYSVQLLLRCLQYYKTIMSYKWSFRLIILAFLSWLFIRTVPNWQLNDGIVSIKLNR